MCATPLHGCLTNLLFSADLTCPELNIFRAHAGTLHSLEDRVKWTAEHTKEELSKSSERLHQDLEPHTQEELKRAHADIPFSTEELLAARGKGQAGSAPTHVHASTFPGETPANTGTRDAAVKVRCGLLHV